MRSGGIGVWTAAALLLTAGLLLFGYGLERTAFRGLYDDVDRALIARGMAERGEWFLPTYHGHPIYTKPPLMYWVAGALYAVTGRQDELPAAATSALASLLVVLLTFLAGRRALGPPAGLLASIMLATSYLFLSMARQPLIDTVMNVGWALVFWSLLEIARQDEVDPQLRSYTRWWLLIALGLGIGTLTKGPALMPLSLIAALPLLRPPRRSPAPREALLAILLFLLIVVPWPVAVLRAAPEAAAVWRQEFITRIFEGPVTHPWTRKPWWFYLSDLGEFLPWLPLLPAAVLHAWRQPQRLWRVLLWWSLGGLFLYSLFSTKRSYYLLPLYPAFALLCGAVWTAALRQALRGRAIERLFRLGGGLTAGLLGLLGLAAAVLPAWSDLGPVLLFAGAGGLVFLLAAGGLVLFLRRRLGLAFLGLAGASVLLELLLVGHVLPPLHDYLSGRPFYREAAPRVDGQPLGVYRANLSMTAFYLDPPHLADWHEEQLRAALAAGEEGLVVAPAAEAARLPGLEPILERDLVSPFGDRRRLGLYRMASASRQEPAATGPSSF
jgi:4-amino-4-deoxy-L-arabinose transferase-like glycosyltransferase